MKKAFTLIEVLVSTFIVFVAVISILNVIQNNNHLIKLLKNNRDFTLKASVAVLENPEISNNYERLKDFNITNDKVMHILKKDNINVKTSNVLSQKLFDLDIYEEINKIKAYNKTDSIEVYTLDIKQ